MPLARHSQPTGIPRPHPWLCMGVQACRLPALKRLKRSKRLKPLQGHINGFLWASSAGKSYPKARSIAFSGRSSVPFARHSQPTGIPRPHPLLFMGVQACRLPALKRLKRSKRLKPLQGHINGFLWASSAGKSYPKARSIAFSGLFMGGQPKPHQCRSPGIRSQRAAQGHINGFLWAFQRRQKLPQGQILLLFLGGPACRSPGIRSHHGIPRPHPWLFMGVQACRLPALKQGHINGFLWASSAGKSYPKARSIAFSGRSSVPLARHSQPPGIPRPHPWLFMGVQACRLPALKRLKRSKPLKPLKGHIHGFFCLPAPKRLKRSKRLKPLKGHINGFFWASKLSVKT